MERSVNTLVFESINIMPINNGNYMAVNAEINVCINFECPESNHIYKRFRLKSEATKLSEIDAIRECIENLFNNEYYNRLKKHMDIYNIKVNCIDNGGINHIQIDLGEPFKTLIQDLCNGAKWNKIDKALNQNN